nr:hypothetical protein [Rhodococcus wratislaviensis]GLK37742.1 hypothetical protein GCM10017611_46070 [Rhodococcus wratislaviensis]
MNSTHLHQTKAHTTSTSWKRFATVGVAAAALGIIPAGVAAATTSTPAPIPVTAVASHDIPRDHDNTMQQRRHDRQRDQRQDRRAEITIGNEILDGWESSTPR